MTSRLLATYGPALLATFGFAWALGSSKVSLLWRNVLERLGAPVGPLTVRAVIFSLLRDLVECPACSSFWIGLAVGRFVFGLAGLALLCYAFVSLAVSLVLAALVAAYE